MKNLYRPLFTSTMLIPAILMAQVDSEPGNNTCEPLFPVDHITLEVPDTAAMGTTGDLDFFRVNVPNGGLLEAIVVPLAGGATFSVQVWDNCISIASATGTAGDTARVAAVVCPGEYDVRVSVTGSAVQYKLLATTTAFDSWMECNNTFATATEIPADTTFPIRLWGQNTELTNGQPDGFDYNGDQDFFKVYPDSNGVLSIQATGPGNLELIITVYDHLMQSVAGNGNPGDGATVTHNVMLCTTSPFYYIRIHDYYEPIYNAYENSPVPFQLSLSFNTDETCECNNTFATACEVPQDITMMTRLFGTNTELTNGQPAGFDYVGDQDFYKVTPQSGGTLSVSATSVPTALDLLIAVYDTAQQLIAVTPQVNHGENAHINLLLCEAPFYYVRVFDRYVPIYDAYENSPTAFQLEFSFNAQDSCACNTDTTVADFTVASIIGGDAVFENNSSDADSYFWQFGDGATSTDMNPTHTYAGNGQYEVTLIAISGCEQDTTTLLIDITSVGLAEHQKPGFSLWPNPTNGTTTLQFRAGMSVRGVTVMNNLGQVILTRALNGSQRSELDLTNFYSGIYLVEVRFADGSKSIERIVKR